MSIIDLPAAFVPHSCTLKLSTSQRVNAAPFGGSEQAVDLLNDRWLLSCELANRLDSDGAWIEAFIGSMRGQTNVTPIYHFARPQPQGTLRGTLTLGAAAAQGARSITVVAAVDGPELVANGTFTTDTSGWTVLNSAALTGGILSVVSGGVRIQNDASGTHYGCASTPIACSVGKTYSVSLTRVGGTGLGGYMAVGTGVTTSTFNNVVANQSSSQFTFVAVAPTMYIGIQAGPPTANIYYDFDNISVKQVTQAGASVESGDMFGVGGLLVMAQSRCIANSSGVVTVPITNALRIAQSSGAAVTWDKPTFLARLLSTNDVGYVPGIANAVSFDFGEKI